MFCPHCGKPVNEGEKFCAACGAALVPATPVYSPFGRRLVAYLMDYVLWLIVLMLFVAFAPAPVGNWVYLPWLLAVWLYKSGMESCVSQATLGKMALGIKVTTRQGERLSFLHATARFLGFVLTSFTALIGFLIAGFTDRRQALHDYIAGTVVVRKDFTPQEIAASPPARGGEAGVAILVVAGIVMLAFIGIIAAIAIPAYQDYTIRAQVTEGLQLAAPIEVQVTQAFGRGEVLTIDAPPSGVYVDSVTLDHNAIVITYGRTANSNIQGRRLVLVPVKASADSVAWACGYKQLDGTRLDSPVLETATTDIAESFLPETCRR